MIYPRQTHYVAAFLRRKWAPYRAMEKRDMLGLVQWFCNHGRCLILKEGGRIQSVCLVRLVSNKEEAKTNYADSGGPVAYIEMCASRTTKAFRSMMNLFYLTFKNVCSHMAWTRNHYRANSYRLVTLEDAFRHIAYG